VPVSFAPHILAYRQFFIDLASHVRRRATATVSGRIYSARCIFFAERDMPPLDLPFPEVRASNWLTRLSVGIDAIFSR
jgi:hypothetical protein